MKGLKWCLLGETGWSWSQSVWKRTILRCGVRKGRAYQNCTTHSTSLLKATVTHMQTCSGFASDPAHLYATHARGQISHLVVKKICILQIFVSFATSNKLTRLHGWPLKHTANQQTQFHVPHILHWSHSAPAIGFTCIGVWMAIPRQIAVLVM